MVIAMSRVGWSTGLLSVCDDPNERDEGGMGEEKEGRGLKGAGVTKKRTCSMD